MWAFPCILPWTITHMSSRLNKLNTSTKLQNIHKREEIYGWVNLFRHSCRRALSSERCINCPNFIHRPNKHCSSSKKLHSKNYFFVNQVVFGFVMLSIYINVLFLVGIFWTCCLLAFFIIARRIEELTFITDQRIFITDQRIEEILYENSPSNSVSTTSSSSSTGYPDLISSDYRSSTADSD